MAMAKVKIVKNVKAGDKVKVLGYSMYTSRTDVVSYVTVNAVGTTLYWLKSGGCFSRREIELFR